MRENEYRDRLLENYFVNPPVFRSIAARLADGGKGLSLTDEECLDRLLEICERLLLIGAASIVLHDNENVPRGRNKDFEEKKFIDELTCGELIEKIIKYFEGIVAENRDMVMADFHRRLDQLKRFGSDMEHKADRLRYLLRIVDGKRLFAHMSHHLKIKLDLRRDAVDRCRDERVDTEDLAAFVSRFSK